MTKFLCPAGLGWAVFRLDQHQSSVVLWPVCQSPAQYGLYDYSIIICHDVYRFYI